MEPCDAMPPYHQYAAHQHEGNERQMENNDHIGQHAIEHVGSRYADLLAGQRLRERRVRACLPRVLSLGLAGAACIGGGSSL